MELLISQETLPLAFTEPPDPPAWVASVRAQSPLLRQVKHFAEGTQGAVACVWSVAQFMVEFGHIRAQQIADAVLAKHWIDEQLYRAPVFIRSALLAVLGYVVG
jgi:hypothetical protein